jgi:hypothetical protein
MIGIIGPGDSIETVLAVAREENLEERTLARAYESLDEAPIIAHELDQVCRVILFTGRAPFVVGTHGAALRARVQFVPHAGADLYRALIFVLREFAGTLPRLSIDTIEEPIVAETYRDLGLAPPPRVIPLSTDADEPAIRSAADLVAAHRALYDAHEVDLCLTCVGSVYRHLTAAGVRAVRVTHTRSAIREALRQADLAARLAQTEATQPAALMISIPERSEAEENLGPYEAQRRRLRDHQMLLDIADRLQGRLVDLGGGRFVVYTSRGMVEASISRLMDGYDSPFRTERLPSGAQVGIGLGGTVAAAEENAQRALVMGERGGDLHIAFPGGEVFRVSSDRRTFRYRLRETDDASVRLGRELGLGPLAVARLTSALRQVDPTAVTASELARAYGIETRSARRLMAALHRVGIATKLGRQGGGRAGRPQTVYCIDVARLIGPEGAA